MKYDPIKRKLGKVFDSAPLLRKLFYRLLDILLLRSWHVRKEIKLWEKTVAGPQDVLDAGSGFGQYDFFMASRNKDWSIRGLDVKQEQIEDCNSFFDKIGLNNASFGLADLTEFSQPGKYDLIICVDVMEHIEEDEKVFGNFYDSLKKGGMLLVSTPSDQGGSDVHEHDHEHGEHDGNQSFIDEHVREGYGVDEIKAKLAKAGFRSSEVYYQYGRPGKLSWKLSMKYPILLLNSTYLFFAVLPFYYLLTLPLSLVLNYFDVRGKHKTGTGIVAKAWK